jgi:hypothetical protein
MENSRVRHLRRPSFTRRPGSSTTRSTEGDAIGKDLAGNRAIHMTRIPLRSELLGRVLHLVTDPEARRSEPVGSLESSTPPLTPF